MGDINFISIYTINISVCSFFSSVPCTGAVWSAAFFCFVRKFILFFFLFTNYISLYDLISTLYEVAELNAFEAIHR